MSLRPHPPHAPITKRRLTIIIRMMKKKEMLNLDYKQEQGILLSWNYTDPSKHPRFYRHVLLLFTSDLTSARNFALNYIKRIKPGDFYYALTLTPDHTLQERPWKQKMARDDFNPEKYLPEPITNHKTPLLLQRVEQDCEALNEPIVLNILMDKAEDAEYFQKTIQDRRRQNHFQFVCALYAPFPTHHLSFNHGFNHFSTLLDPLSQLIQANHQFVNQAAISHAALRITCNNGILTSQDQEQWQNENFNTIVRHYYGPPAAYKVDVIRFLNCNLAESGNYELTLRLEFSCLEGGLYDTRKNIVVNFNKNSTHNLTMAPSRVSKAVRYEHGIQLSNDPYASKTTVSFNKIDDGTG